MKKENILKASVYLALIGLGFLGYLYVSGLGSGTSGDAIAEIVSSTPGLDDASLADGGDAQQEPSSTESAFPQSNATAPREKSVPASKNIKNEQTTTSPVFAITTESSSETDPMASSSIQPSLPEATPIVPVTPACSFNNNAVPAHHVILNEIAWMGTLPENGETSAKASEREWIELKNVSNNAIDISGWQILDLSGNLKILVGASSSALSSAKIPADAFFLLVRGGVVLPNGIKPDSGYSGSLSNAGDDLELLDANCAVEDIIYASSGWPAGNNTTKQTLERDADDNGWHTSAPIGGTPRAENSIPVPPPKFIITVSMVGSGAGIVSSTPAGIVCGLDCEVSFASGTIVKFSAIPTEKSIFKNWSGACAGATSTTCSIAVSGSSGVTAEFDSITTPIDPRASVLEDDSAPTSSIDHLMISAIQISGASSSNDFVKIYNPTQEQIDISGWKLHKKSSTGTDYSLKTFTASSSIVAGGTFIWANSSGGYAGSINADVSSTETLSADNSVALIDGSAAVIDAVAWGNGTGQYVEGDAYPTSPGSGQILIRKATGGVLADTNNNASDFEIQ
jgi:hypothetical protein